MAERAIGLSKVHPSVNRALEELFSGSNEKMDLALERDISGFRSDLPGENLPLPRLKEKRPNS